MTQYISKDDAAAEIKKRKREAESNCGGYKSYEEHRCNACIVDFYEEFLEILDTLEVKEIKLPNPRFPHLNNIVDKVLVQAIWNHWNMRRQNNLYCLQRKNY